MAQGTSTVPRRPSPSTTTNNESTTGGSSNARKQRKKTSSLFAIFLVTAVGYMVVFNLIGYVPASPEKAGDGGGDGGHSLSDAKELFLASKQEEAGPMGGSNGDSVANLLRTKKKKPTKSDMNTGGTLVKVEASKEAPAAPSDSDVQAVEEQHTIAGLSCAAHGGPSDEIASEMVYWRDVPADATYVSPFKQEAMDEGVTKYLTFESDQGGWNNIRMSMETVLVMAAAMGRTLVLPPELEMYLLGKKKGEQKGKQKHHFSFSDFFHLDSLAREHHGFDMISMKEYLQREAVTGHLIDESTNKPSFPPKNRTEWDGNDEEVEKLFRYLRSSGHVLKHWDPDACLAAFPASTNPHDVTSLQHMMHNITDPSTRLKNGQYKNATLAKQYRWERFVNNPVPVNGPPLNRLAEHRSNRKNLCIYDEELRQAKTVHFLGDDRKGGRLLTHFYAFLFFQDWTQDVWAKRFVRDHVRYKDELMCAAARVVDAVRARARKNGDSKEGEFDSFHIRRGDFQYKDTRVTAEEIVDATKDVLKKGGTVYIASDERNKTFFGPLAERYDVCFLDDFKHLIPDLNTNYYGMLDQLVSSRGRHFVGTFLSTFTGYINRMRGYHSTKKKIDGYKDGIIDSWYFVPKHNKEDMRSYQPLHFALWAREFPTAWRDIDHGVEESIRSGKHAAVERA